MGSEFLRKDIFEQFSTILLPGAIALAPYCLVIANTWPSLKLFAETHPAVTGIVLSLGASFLGLVIDGVGTRIETCWDSLLKGENENFEETWKAYLRTPLDSQLVAHKYVSKMVVGMKFELASSIALIMFGAGIVWANILVAFMSYPAVSFWAIACLLLSTYLLWESYSTAGNLADAREEIVRSASE